ncbi:hypothetical protein [Oryzobacter terrae]|uniref:hypothetical protein n=1 Tax=Oryzobacter terrae TaxID=1620385 RepID=UPI00366EB1F8
MSVVVALVVVMGVLLALGTVLVLVLLDGSRPPSPAPIRAGQSGTPGPEHTAPHHTPWLHREDGAGGA